MARHTWRLPCAPCYEGNCLEFGTNKMCGSLTGSGLARPPLVYVIILNWNGLDLTLATLRSLQGQTYPRLRTLVLDNGSVDGESALSAIRREFPEVELFYSRRNLGFAGGCNAGMKIALRSGANYLFLLNNDVLLEKSATTELVAVLEANPEVGAACPLIYYEADRDRVWFSGGRLRLGGRVQAEHEPDEPVSAGDLSRGSDWLPGTAILARRECVEQAGPMDPRYFLYWEDVDWSMRIKRAGYRLVVVPRAILWHKINASTGTLPRPLSVVYYWERNRLRFIERWGGWRSLVIAISKIVWRSVAWRVHMPQGDPQAATKLEAYRDYILRRFGPRSS